MNRVVSQIQTTNISDTNKMNNATATYIAIQVGPKLVATEKEEKNLGGKGESRIPLKSDGGM